MVTDPEFWGLLFGSATVYWLLPKGRTAFLAGVSFVYLLYQDPASVLALAGWSVLFYFASRRAARDDKHARWVLGGLILSIAAYLGYFKYLPPLLDAFSVDWFDRYYFLPLGISFFTFKLIHYAVEVSRGNVKSNSPALFLSYVFLFPIFTAGPIERYDHFLHEREDEPSFEAVAEGLMRIVYGLIKKFAIGGLLVRPILDAPSTNEILESLDVVSPLWVWWHVFWLFFYSYLDFSAYSDIAIGSSRLFGFRIMENFNWPILAPNISEFWSRWHMTLTGWCRAYVYLPLIGITRNPYVATFGAFTVIGLWHEGLFNYLAWGLYHATGISIYQAVRRFKRQRKWKPLRGRFVRVAGTVITIAYVSGSYAFTATAHASGITAGFRMLARLIWLPTTILNTH